MFVIRVIILCCVLTAATGTKRIGSFWHITDVHLDTNYGDGNENVSTCNTENYPYGDFWCDSPYALVKSAIEFMARRQTDVDFVIWTGDTVAYVPNDETDLMRNLAILRNVTDDLSNAMPNVPIYPSLGNHDFYPDGQAPFETTSFYVQVADLWKMSLKSESNIKTFSFGGFFSTNLPGSPNIRLLALNTNLYYTTNKLTPTIEDPAGQFIWMEEQLEEAEAEKQTVIITGHVPPGLKTPGLVEWFYPAHKRRFMDILFKYSHIITALHFGHDHEDGFKVLQDDNDIRSSKAVPQFTAPSVTPKMPNKDGSIVTGTPRNPAIRLVKYDKDTGRHLDYIQFYLDLKKANEEVHDHWEELYSFTKAYDVWDMSATSVRSLLNSFRTDKGRLFLNKYCIYGSVNTRYLAECTETMRREIYCGGIYHNATEASACVSNYPTSTSNDIKVHSYNYLMVIVLMVVSTASNYKQCN